MVVIIEDHLTILDHLDYYCY